MPRTPPPGNSTFDGPATYRIVVGGVLDESWTDRLSGMVIKVSEGGGHSPRTMLCGPIRDQAQLNGLLESLYGLHLPILSVEQVENDEE